MLPRGHEARYAGSMRTAWRGRGVVCARLFIALIVGATGCSSLLGLEDWTDPPLSSEGGGMGGVGSGGAITTSTATTSTSHAGGPGSCADGAQDPGETDVDCGGDACPPCALGRTCGSDADCESGHCDAGACAEAVEPACDQGPDPTCHDCVANGVETDVDCGGETCLPCGLDGACLWDGDCLSSVCQANHCAAGAPGASCQEDADCQSAQCAPGDCALGTCCQ